MPVSAALCCVPAGWSQLKPSIRLTATRLDALTAHHMLQVALDGVSVDYLNPDVKLPKAAEQELQW